MTTKRPPSPIVLLLAGLIVTALIAVAGAWWMRATATAVDPETGCARAAPPAQHVLALVDVAGVYDPREPRRAAAAVRQVTMDLAPGDRLTLATSLPENPARVSILISRCAPLSNDREARAAFNSDVGRATRLAIRPREQDAAPLTDTIRALVEDRTAEAPAQTRRLILVSDMMENRPGVFSLYAAGATYETFRASEAGQRPVANLSGMNVTVTQLERSDRMARQIDARELFWRPYFAAAGAGAVTWAP